MKKSNFEFIKEYYPLLVSITILLVISVFHLVKDDLLIDESSSLLTSELSLNKVLHRALFWEEQAPLYYLVLAIWRLVSAHYIFARLLSLIFMLGSFLFMFRIFKKYESSQVLTTLMLILVAVNFNIVYAAVNIRYYSFTILLSVFLLYIFLNHYLNQQPARLSIRILFSIIAIVAISSQYFIGFLLLALGFTVFVKLGFKRFLHYCLDMLPAIFVVFVLLTSILHQMGTYEFLQGDDRSIFTLAKYLFFRFSSYVISFHFLFEINWFKYGMSAIFFSLIVYCFRFYKRIHPDAKYILLIVSVVYLCISVVYYRYGDTVILPYHTLTLLFPTVLLTYFIIKLLSFKLQIVIVVLLILMNMPTEIIYALKPKTISELNQYLTKNENEDESIFVFPTEYKHLINYHYTGKNELIGVPFQIDYNKGYRINQWAIRDCKQLDSLFTIYQNEASTSFYVIKEKNYFNYNFDYHVDSLYYYLKNNYKIEQDTFLKGYLVQKYSTIKMSK